MDGHLCSVQEVHIPFSIHYSLVPIEERTRSVWDISEEMRADFAKFPEIVDFQVTTTQNMGSFGGNAVDVEVYGYDITASNLVAKELADKIRNIPGTKDVTISRDKSKPELQIIFDQEKMSANGLNTAMAAVCCKEQD